MVCHPSYLCLLYDEFAGLGHTLASNRLRVLKPLRLLPAYVATAVAVVLIVLGINILFEHQLPLPGITFDAHVKTVESELPNYNFAAATSKIIQVSDPPSANLGAAKVGEGLTAYEIGVGDTPELLALKYGVETKRDYGAKRQVGNRPKGADQNAVQGL